MINIAIGLGAGAAAALLFASLASGSLLALVLFYLAPLPILIAAIGWSHWAALVAAAVASVGLAALFGPLFSLAFLAGVGLPAWWLGYLALLAQPAVTADGRADGLIWYPPGHLVFWTACLGTAIVIACIPFFGFDFEAIKSSLRASLDRALGLTGDKPPTGELRAINTEFLATIAPMMVVLMLTLIQSVNLWLAAKVALVSGRLRRPWPAIAEMRLPPIAPVLLAAAIAGTLLLGFFSIPAVLLASLLTAYALVGLAVVHAMTRSMGGRSLMLFGVYGIMIIYGWPTMVMSAIGVADSFLDIRRRWPRKSGPPAKT